MKISLANIGQKRLYFLLGILIVSGAVLPVTRFYLHRKPALLPASASVEAQKRYWLGRIKSDVSDTEAYLKLGILEEQNGFYISAERYLRSARLLGASDQQVCPPLGRVLSHLAKEEEAILELKKALSLTPHNPEAILNLAGSFTEAQRTDEAVRLLKKWLEAHSEIKDNSVLERLILAFLSSGEEKEAQKISKKFLRLYPDDVGALSLSARCDFSLGELESAQVLMEKLLPNAPDPVGARYLYGMILNQQKKYDDALKIWQEANKINPSAIDIYEKIGYEYMRRADYKKAAYAFERIATSDQKFSTALLTATAYEKSGDRLDSAYWYAIAAGFRGDFKTAFQQAEQASNIDEPRKRRRAKLAVAEAYRGLKRNTEYLQLIEELASKRTLEDLILLIHAYNIVEDQETIQKRLICLREAIQKSPKNYGLFTLQLVEQLHRMGRKDEAESQLEKALSVIDEKAQGKTELMQQLIDFYMDRREIGNRLDKATKLAEKVVRLSPQDEKAWLALGQCYAANNQLAFAATCLEHVIDIEPGSGPSYQELARVYAKQGKTEASQQMMQLYSKYVGFEQKRQTLQTRARGEKARLEDIIAYADLLLTVGDLETAASEFERALQRSPKDNSLKKTLESLYVRLGYTNRLSLDGTKT
jgi:tetratricopeptide (TPR) repeat protein